MSNVHIITPEEYAMIKDLVQNMTFTDSQVREIAAMNGIDVSIITSNIKEYMLIYHLNVILPYFVNLTSIITDDQVQRAINEITSGRMFLTANQLRGIAQIHNINIIDYGDDFQYKLYMWLFHRFIVDRYIFQELRRKQLEKDLGFYNASRNNEMVLKTVQELNSIPPLPTIQQPPPPPIKIAPKKQTKRVPSPSPHPSSSPDVNLPIIPQSPPPVLLPLQLQPTTTKYVPIRPGKRPTQYYPPPSSSKRRKTYRDPKELIWISENEMQQSSRY